MDLDEHPLFQDSVSDGSYNPYDAFYHVLQVLRLDLVPDFVMGIRRRLMSPDSSSPNLSYSFRRARVQHPPIYGGFHVLFPIVFDDGEKWLLKIPGCGDPDVFDDGDAERMQAEVWVMKEIKRHTGIPVPEVFAYATDFEILGCPFILMQFIEGEPLSNVWWDEDEGESVLAQRRTRALQELARASVQLSRWTFSEGGLVVANERDGLLRMTSQRCHDNAPAFEKEDNEQDPEILDDAFYESGVFTNVQSFFLHHIERRLAEPNLVAMQRGNLLLAKMMLNWFFAFTETEARFESSHPDFDHQNILVSGTNGSLHGILDWDGVAAAPRVLGCLRYPSFLTRDWDPAMHEYGEVDEEGESLVAGPPDSPEMLQHYRSIYVESIGEVTRHQYADDPYVEAIAQAAMKTMKQSLLVEALNIAAREPMCTAEIIQKFVQEMGEIENASRSVDDDEQRDEEEKEFAHDSNLPDVNITTNITEGALETARIDSGLKIDVMTNDAVNSADSANEPLQTDVEMMDVDRDNPANGESAEDRAFEDEEKLDYYTIVMALAEGRSEPGMELRLKAAFERLLENL
ncbi:MAG: hypothetical protein Q9159_002920 [Coniocarpon cinnabarinum]